MWNFFSQQAANLRAQAEDLFRLIPRNQQTVTTSTTTGTLPAVDDDFDQAQIEWAIRASRLLPGEVLSLPVPPTNAESVINGEVDEATALGLAIQASLAEPAPQPAGSSVEAFIKLRQFLEAIAIPPALIESIAKTFNNYAEECYTSAGNLRDGKTFIELRNEYLALDVPQQIKLSTHIQTLLDNQALTYVNKIGGIIPFFSRSSTLADAVDRLPNVAPVPRMDTTATTTSTSSSAIPTPAPLPIPVILPAPAAVFLPSAPLPVATTTTTSSSSLSAAPVVALAPEEQSRIQKLEVQVRRSISLELRKTGQAHSDQIDELDRQTNYSNCRTFAEKEAALAQQLKLIDALVASQTTAAASAPATTTTTTDSDTEHPSKRRRHK